MQIQPYLFFNDRCDEAIEFYTRTLGAQLVDRMSFSESPEPHPPGMIAPGRESKVMHASLRIGDTLVMASDGMGNDAGFKGISLALSVPDAPAADRAFAALAEGGQVQMPIGKTFFAPRFGMVADRFGVSWMVIAAA